MSGRSITATMAGRPFIACWIGDTAPVLSPSNQKLILWIRFAAAANKNLPLSDDSVRLIILADEHAELDGRINIQLFKFKAHALQFYVAHHDFDGALDILAAVYDE